MRQGCGIAPVRKLTYTGGNVDVEVDAGAGAGVLFGHGINDSAAKAIKNGVTTLATPFVSCPLSTSLN